MSVAAETLGARRGRASFGRAGRVLVPVLTVAAFLGLWELVCRSGLVSQTEIPAMSTTVRELWDVLTTNTTPETAGLGDPASYWGALARTVRGWAIGLGLAILLAVPTGILLGSNDYAGRAFRIPIEFLRPIPSAVLIPLLFLLPGFGISLKSEVFLATFGAFWPLLVQTMYGVRDVDPVAADTARSFRMGRLERLYRITFPSALPYIMTGIRISSNVALILAFTAELFGVGTAGLGQKQNFAQNSLATPLVYAIALTAGFLGLAIHLLLVQLERRVLFWHASQRQAAP
jgi:ABC-type nitrate/sulfonate/bicarbonate transport system permease component